VTDADFFTVPAPETNSIAVLVKHLGGNLRSRWTDYFDSDGEKPDRDRDGEFEIRGDDTRASLMKAWEAGWDRALSTVEGLSPDDLDRTVRIRGQRHHVEDAITTQFAHAASHVGQILYAAKMAAGASWQTLSIPRGGSAQYNRDAQAEADAGKNPPAPATPAG
jgi:hypothetical protein